MNIGPWVFRPPFDLYYTVSAKSQSQGKCQEFCCWPLTAFITQTLGLWGPACDKDCQTAVRPAPWQRISKEWCSFTLTEAGPSPSAPNYPSTFWENTHALLPFKRWKTNLSYPPAVPISLNSVSVLNFYVMHWNIFCCKILHTVVNFATIFLEEI